MSALPRPELAPGPSRTLNDALHDLHHRAGWPSLRTLARETGVSHTTVSKAFSRPALPTWGTTELLVEAMGGDVVVFHELWLAASTPTNGAAPVAPLLAGRRAELTVVRHHLDTGTGLLVVTGEAGIGKTTLIRSAVCSVETFVAVGLCHPLSADVPLMPIAEMLRKIRDLDSGQWLNDALADCPPYVTEALARLLPELADTTPPGSADEFARQRLFTAVSTVLEKLGELRPLALVLEDVHWADLTTLDILEHLLDRPHPPLVTTVRTDDPGVAHAIRERVSHLRERSTIEPLVLTPLDRAATFDQLALTLGRAPDEELVDAIYARGQGLPLFTEQLASAGRNTVPDGLADLLDSRLGVLDGDEWSIMCALGVADRPLPSPVLQAAASLDADQMVAGLRDLSDRRLLGAGGDAARLRHPLLGEAVRRRLVPGEARLQHRHLAEALAQEPDSEPGEIAHHWHRAGEDAQELVWRLTAAERADERLASREAFDSWSRALELWPSVEMVEGGHTLPHVLSRAIDTARRHGRVDRALELTQRLRDVGAEGPELAELLRHAGELRCLWGDVTEGMSLLSEAVDIHSGRPASPGLVHCLDTRASMHVHTGSFAEARVDIDRALDVAVEIGDSQGERRILTWAAWLALAEGNFAGARELSQKVLSSPAGAGDPFVEVALALNATDILLHLGAPVAVVDVTAERGLALADRWGLTVRLVGMLRCNVAEAHLRAGDVGGAFAVLLEVTASAPTFASYDAHGVRVAVDTARGLVDEAVVRVAALDALPHVRDVNWAETQLCLATADLWAGRERAALARLEEAVACLLGTDNALLAAAATALAARAAADARDGEAAARLRVMVGEAAADPFGPTAIGVAAPVWRLVWTAELHRLEGSDSADGWVKAALGWDQIGRPHDAGYCRWRAAQSALREGRGTVAVRLLERAAIDAREHVPLSNAIARTRAGAR